MKMKISKKTIGTLAHIITGGDNKDSPLYRDIVSLVDFFSEFKVGDFYHSGLPPRLKYTKEKLNEFNAKELMQEVIERALDPKNYELNSFDSNEAAAKLDKDLKKDGYKIRESYRIDPSIPEGFVCEEDENHYVRYYGVYPLEETIIDIETEVSLSNNFIKEQIQKSKEKLEQSDYDGAITNARSLVEAVQKEIISKSGETVPDYNGNILNLYKATKKVMNFDASQKDLSETLKLMLSGLNSLVSSISGLSNKMGDRHARTYKPSRHHARLVVNASFIFCEFLLDSYEYQKNKKISSKK
ncbi:MAG: abortive infection family protein [Candidatus Halichondribacter symbioticus]